MLRLSSIIFSLFICLTAASQGNVKKDIAQAKASVKSGKDLEKAENLMRKLLTDSVNKDNLKIYDALAEVVKKQYEQGNEKLYLKQKYDTASLFTTARKMFLVYELQDSAESASGKTPKSRKKNVEYLNSVKRNLFNGGLFFIRKQEFSKAYDMLDTYIDCINQPLFGGKNSNGNDTGNDSQSRKNDNLNIAAAYWAVYCGYRMQNPDKALKYSEMAVKSVKGNARAIQYVAEAYIMKNDTAMYLSTLHKGFETYRTSPYFFTRLVDYFNSQNHLDSTKQIIETALQAAPDNTLFLLAQSGYLLNTGNYRECVNVCDDLIAGNDTLAEAYYNAGVAYVNMAFVIEKKKQKSTTDKQLIQNYYRKALPYVERYRSLAPEQKDKWLAVLYNIYLNLNMGKEFEEVERLLRMR